MVLLNDEKHCKLYVSQIIDNFHDLAQFLCGDTETIVNKVQRTHKSVQRQNEQLTILVMLREAMGKEVSIEHTPSGRPILKGSDLHVSISHSKNHATLLISNNNNIGVDIEKISPRILRLQRRIAQPKELPADFAAFPEYQQIKYLTILWTIKEAVYKSMNEQEGFDLLTDVLVTPSDFGKMPSIIEVSVKNLEKKLKVVCREFEGNILTYVIR